MIEKIPITDDLRSVSHPLRREILHVLSASYIYPEGFLDDSLARGEYIYLSRNNDRSVRSFFITNQHKILVENIEIPVSYWGLCATHENVKGSGDIYNLLLAESCEILKREQSMGSRILIYFTTTTPEGYLLAQTLLENISPRLDKSVLSSMWQTVLAIRNYLSENAGIPVCNEDHLCVLRKYAPHILYCDEEIQRISRLSDHLGIDHFEVLNIDIKAGDRLIVSGYLKRNVSIKLKECL